MNYKVNKKVAVLDLGLVDYEATWKKQETLFEATIAQKIANRKVEEEEQIETTNYLLFCQHPHVYTLGKSGKEEHLLLDSEHLNQVQAQFYKINRGGDITYHGPGQVVCYPILDLDNFFTDIHLYMRTLEEAVILTLADFGISAGRVEGLTGVWLGHDGKSNPRKICAMGVKSSRWVTMHGLALNVNTDLSYFGNIVPCGISDKAVTSMNSELNKDLDMDLVVKTLQNHIVELFKMQII